MIALKLIFKLIEIKTHISRIHKLTSFCCQNCNFGVPTTNLFTNGKYSVPQGVFRQVALSQIYVWL